MCRCSRKTDVRRLLLAALVVAGCSPGGSAGSSAPTLSYSLLRTATGLTTNALILDYPEDTGYEFKITASDGVISDTPFDVFLPMQPRVDFVYSAEGEHSIDLEIVQANGTPYVAETLAWTYSTEVPFPPIVSFSEAATKDASVTLQVGGLIDPDTQEIWVEGDIAGEPSWQPLPDSALYLFNVSDGDGLKTMSVKLRNIYGNESEAVPAAILRNGTTPTECTVEYAGSSSQSRRLDLKLTATDDIDLYYIIYGDVTDEPTAKKFISGETIETVLTQGEGDKEVTVRIQDGAGNRCDDITQTINLSGTHYTTSVEVEDKPFYADDDQFNLLITYDHFATAEPIEMKITGDVYGTGVNQWVPLATEYPVTAFPGAGEKKVYVKFRDNTLVESFTVMARVFYQPSITLEDAGAPAVNVRLSKIAGTSSITIVGCATPYTDVAYATSYPCLPNAPTVQATYKFSDNSTLVLSGTP